MRSFPTLLFLRSCHLKLWFIPVRLRSNTYYESAIHILFTQRTNWTFLNFLHDSWQPDSTSKTVPVAANLSNTCACPRIPPLLPQVVFLPWQQCPIVSSCAWSPFKFLNWSLSEIAAILLPLPKEFKIKRSDKTEEKKNS